MLVVLICLATVAAGQLIAYTRTDDLDRWQYAYFGQRMLAGDAIYADLWDVKPPLHYWINAAGLWITRGDDAGIIAVCATGSVLSVLMLYAACRAFAAALPALLTAALGAFFLSHGFFFGGTNRSETSEIFLELAAVAMYAHFRRTRRWWLALGAGVAVGAALGAKQSAAALLVAMLLDVAARIAFASSTRRRAVGTFFLLVIGGGIGVAAWLWPTLRAADWRVVYDALIGFHRVHLQSIGRGILSPELMPLRAMLTILGVPLILAGVAVVHTLLAVTARSSDEHEPDLSARLVPMLAVWWMLGVLQVALAPHEQPHYWLPTLSPLLLLGGVTIHRMLRDDGLVPAFRRRPGVLVAAVALAILGWPAFRSQRDSVITGWAAASEAHTPSLAERIAQRVNETDDAAGSVLVWGHAPEMYYRLGRPPACRFIGTHYFFLPNGAGRPWFKEMIARLNDAPPEFIILDRPPDAVAAEAQSAGLDASALLSLLEDYEVSATVDGVTIHRRRAAQSSSG